MEIGAREVEFQPAIPRNEGQAQGPGVDAKAVAAESEDLGPLFEDVLSVPLGAHRFLASRLEPGVHLVGPYAVAELPQAVGEVPQPAHHGVGGEVGVELLAAGEGGSSSADAFENAFRRPHEVVGPALALVQQPLLFGTEDFVDVFPLRRESFQVVVEFAEAALQVLQLKHQP